MNIEQGYLNYFAMARYRVIKIKIEQMKKQEHETFKTGNRRGLNKDHFDWLLFAFLTIVIILLVVAISV